MYFEVKENENEPVYLTKVSLFHGSNNAIM
jgi:hypothetical protein